MDYIRGLPWIVVFVVVAVLMVLWVMLPFAVFGIKERLEELAEEAKKIRDKIDRLEGVLDPDGKRAELCAKHQAKIEEQRLEEEDRRQPEEMIHEEQVIQEKEQRTMDRNLAKSKGLFQCPHCEKEMSIKDIRSGTAHKCPHCGGAFEVA